MDFDVKDVKTWATRNDVKAGDEGYFADFFSNLKRDDRIYKGRISSIEDDTGQCFYSDFKYKWFFFLPLSAVKEDKPKEKKYRPFGSMAEFTKVVYNLVPNNLNITGVGESFMVRRKYNGHYEKVLITHLEYDENHELLSINGQSLRDLFENYDIVTDDDKIIPFGVEVENE